MKILIKRTGAMGDVIMATPVIFALAISGEHQISFETACPEVLQNNPLLDAVYSRGSTVNYDDFDRVIDLDGAYEKRPKMHVIDAYLEEAGLSVRSETQMFPDETTLARMAEMASQLKNGGKRLAIIHPAVSWMNRTWDVNDWVNVVFQLQKLNFEVVTVGTRNDQQVLGTRSMQGCLGLLEIQALISSADVFLGMDSGILHIAGTTETPTVGLFTCALSKYRLPFRENCIGIDAPIECVGCLHELPPPVTFAGCRFNTNACLKAITPEMVVRAVIDLCPGSTLAPRPQV